MLHDHVASLVNPAMSLRKKSQTNLDNVFLKTEKKGLLPSSETRLGASQRHYKTIKPPTDIVNEHRCKHSNKKFRESDPTRVVLEFEPRASCQFGKRCTSWPSPQPVLSFYSIFRPHVFAWGQPWTMIPLPKASRVAWITGVHHPAWLIC